MTNELLAPLEWRTEKRKVSDLIPYKYNPRKLSEVRKEKLRRSLEKFNLVEIPVIDVNNVLISGHQRVYMLFDLGRGEEVIDVRIPNRELTEEEFKEYNLISNIDYAEFDWDMIDKHFNEIDLEDIGMDMVAYDDFIEQTNMTLVEEEGDVDTELPEEPLSKMGDVFEFLSQQKGIKHRIVCGDSTKKESYNAVLGENEVFNMVVTDPPYNVNYEGGTKQKLKIKNDNMSDKAFYDFLLSFFTNTNKRSMLGGPIYIFYSDSEAINFRKAMQEANFKISSVLIWVKNNFVLGRLDYHMKHEPLLVGELDCEDEVKRHQGILYGWREGAKHPWYSDRKQSSILEFDKPKRNADHPTMKPLEMIIYLIKNSSKQKDIVGDMFLGSGTTLIACEQSWRHCRAVEFDPKYIDVAVRRYIRYMKENKLSFTINKNGVQMTDSELESYSK